MLEFASREEWFAPWQSRPNALKEMLRLHGIFGDSREQEPYEETDDGVALTAFGALVERETAALAALPAPEQSKRIAAKSKRLPKSEEPITPQTDAASALEEVDPSAAPILP